MKLDEFIGELPKKHEAVFLAIKAGALNSKAFPADIAQNQARFNAIFKKACTLPNDQRWKVLARLPEKLFGLGNDDEEAGNCNIQNAFCNLVSETSHLTEKKPTYWQHFSGVHFNLKIGKMPT